MFTEDNLRATVKQAGGTLIVLPLMRITFGPNGGCGSPIYVTGTNGGQMLCGAMLTKFGVTAPYYCGYCEQEHRT